MKIGVDIDGVLNDFYGFLVDYGTKYSVEHGVSGIQNPGAAIQTEMYGWNLSVGRDFWKHYAIIQTSEYPARVFAAEVLKKLRDQGNQIWVLTGRSDSDMQVDGMDGRSWEEITRDWLKRNCIVYDEIVFGMKNKAKFCAQEGLGVMIEDNPCFLKDFQADGETKLLIYNTPYNAECEIGNALRVYSWYDIYVKIKDLCEERL